MERTGIDPDRLIADHPDDDAADTLRAVDAVIRRAMPGRARTV